MPTKTLNVALEARGAPPARSGDPARRARIAIAAYYRAERRGFAPGRELEDWLEAERELDRAAAAVATPAPGAAARVASGTATEPDAGTKARAPKSRGSTQRTTRG